jgi:hypothetical protein
MKLSTAQVEQTLSQFDAMALPDDHPVVPQLNSMFGDHTFFLDRAGLNVLERVEGADGEPETGAIVNLASWAGIDRTSLVPHEPETTGMVVILSKH